MPVQYEFAGFAREPAFNPPSVSGTVVGYAFLTSDSGSHAAFASSSHSALWPTYRHPSVAYSPLQVTVVKVIAGEPKKYVARTDLGRRLLALRERAIAEGMQLMTWDDIDKEVRIRRGGASDD